ncbi:unnamed protein product [Rotaria sordida]|uniref:Uncharacterized protein n=2 Tax=Rotaria sordida TaxID=392033 RepID=A0A818FU28_9BILA|nr:unnamed protein product [Rotaria sordida]
MFHMFSIWLLLLITQSINIIIAINLRCNEDINGSFQIIENCRACVIFIAPAILSTPSTTTKATTLTKNMFTSYAEPSLEELFLFGEAKRRRRRRRRRDVDTIIHQQCARELDGPLYGYDQTHCYCNSNQCNSNIQRCIYEVTSKRHFACYHGSNSSLYPLEIRHKCRSCRIRTEFKSMYHYECLIFGEREQNNRTHCTCQRPMCNQDVSTCQRFQQAPSQPRLNLALDVPLNSTISTTITTTTMSTSTSTIKIFIATTATTTTTTTASTTTSSSSTSMTTTVITTTSSTSSSSTTTATTIATTTIVTTTLLVTTTPITTTLPAIIETEEEISIENSTIIELTSTNEITTSFNEIQHLKTVYIDVKNHGNYLLSNFLLICTLFQTFFSFLFIRCYY